MEDKQVMLRQKLLRDELAMIADGDHEKIMAYGAKYCFYDEALIALIERGNQEEIMNYVSHGLLASLKNPGLAENKEIMSQQELVLEELAMIMEGDHEKIMAYGANHQFSENAQSALIRRGNHEEIMNYISHRGFFCGNVLLNDLLPRGNHEEIVTYVAVKPVSDEVEVALINRGNHEEIIALIKRWAGLCRDAAFAVVRCGNHEEIMALINSQRHLPYGFELAVIKRGNHEEIMAVIAKSEKNFEEEAEVALFQREIGRENHEEIMAYLDKYSSFLYRETIDFLFRRGNDEEMEAFVTKNPEWRFKMI